MKNIGGLLLLFVVLIAQAQPFNDGNSIPFEEYPEGNKVDSILNQMSLREQIAQLLMVAMYPNKDVEHDKGIENLISQYHIGGLIVFQGSPEQATTKLNKFQSLSKVPLLTAIDGEWGPGMRLSDSPVFPKAMALGAISDDSLIYSMGVEIAAELKRMGIFVNFAPVVDVNNNPNNPVIGIRSFGEDPDNVIRKANLYMRGMQDNGIMAVLKHFPGHGDTDKDSHKALPEILHDRLRLDSIELKPFKALIDSGAMGVMTAHLYIPALDSNQSSISSLSPLVVKQLLKKELMFKGLVFTDALNMKGAADYYGNGAIEVQALLAGNDVLLMPKDVPLAIESIVKAVENKIISHKQIKKSCRKILNFKYDLDIAEQLTHSTDNLSQDLNNPKAAYINRRLSEKSLTMIVNQNHILPLTKLKQKRIVSLSIGQEEPLAFNQMLEKYIDFQSIHLSNKSNVQQMNNAVGQLKNDDVLIISFQGNIWTASEHFGFSESWRNFIAELNNSHPVILVMFGNPYTLNGYAELERLNAVLIAYQKTNIVQQMAAQAIVGSVEVNGKLPVNVNNKFPVGFGINSGKPIRLGYAIPEELGIDRKQLLGIDSIIQDGIKQQAFPGCQVLIAKNGKVFYNQNFGYYTYDSIQPVSDNSIYDIASITKISATVITLMKLQDDGLFSLEDKLGDYLPELVDTTDYKNLSFKSMLAHQAGLTSWIPFYLNTLDSLGYKPNTFSVKKTPNYSVQVADNLFIKNSFRDSIYSWIIQTPLRDKIKYLYSDIGYYFFLKIIESQTGNSLDSLADNLFYSPLGLRYTGYLPLTRFDNSLIVPTENDTIFRDQVIKGYVHDPGAAMLGGVGGHAGLFTTASELAVIMQMLLNNGTYGGERFISEEVINIYTECQFCEDDNRRGAGFDKPVRDESSGPTCNCISFDSYGHSGFTGTIAWVDPDKDVVYIFLSNRVYPTAENIKLIKMNIRTKIQEEIYKSLDSFSYK
jgi:beta-glucosidase-like glycosyl hydrolase/CubicO group peptidase (beta-lactamase class C family)